MNKKRLFAIVGPTAVGKTDIAIEVAKNIDAEIISADSMQIYKYMDIGTAKATPQQQKQVKHYMIDVVYPDEEFSVADFQSMTKNCLARIYDSGKKPMIVGGTGLYVNSVCYNYTFSKIDKDEALREELRSEAVIYGNSFLYEKLKKVDPIAAKKIHPNNLRRVIRALEVYIKTGKPFSYYEQRTKNQENPYKLTLIGLTRPRVELYERINKRVKLMIELGLVEEVEALLNLGYGKDLNSMQGLGYRQIIDYLEGTITMDEAIKLISRDTRRFAKRQYTWFSRDNNIIWVDVSKENSKRSIEDIINTGRKM